MRKILENMGLALLLSLLLTSCAQHPAKAPSYVLSDQRLPQSADYYLQQAEPLASPEREKQQLLAVQALLQEQQFEQAKQLLETINEFELPTSLQTQKTLLEARLQLRYQHNQQALAQLSQLDGQNLQAKQHQQFVELMAIANERAGRLLASIIERDRLENLLQRQADQMSNRHNLWRLIKQLPAPQLKQLKDDPDFPATSNLHGWFQLAWLVDHYQSDHHILLVALKTWQQQFPDHPAKALVKKTILAPLDTQTKHKQHLVLLLPLQGAFGTAGQAIRNGFMAALYAMPANIKDHIDVTVIDSSKRLIIDTYQQAVQAQPDFIIGPLSRENVDKLAIKRFINIPTLALNYSHSRYKTQPHLYQLGLSPRDEAKQVADYVKTQQHQHALLIIPEGSWGQDVADTFSSEFESAGGNLVDVFKYKKTTPFNQAIKALLHVDQSQQRSHALRKLLGRHIHAVPYFRQDFDMFFLVATPQIARQIAPLLKFYFAGNMPIYATSSVYGGLSSAKMNHDLSDITFCDIPWLFRRSPDPQLAPTVIAKLWPNKQHQNIRLYALGMDAFHLSQQASKLADPNFKMKGTTGLLTLDKNQQLRRQLLWVTMKDGKPHIIR